MDNLRPDKTAESWHRAYTDARFSAAHRVAEILLAEALERDAQEGQER